MIGAGIVAAIGGIALAGASYAERGLGGMGFFAMGQFGLVAMEMFESIDTDGDGKLSQAEIDKDRNDLHAAHDGDNDGKLSLDEFAGVWHETTCPLTVRAFQMLDKDGNALISRAEYDRPLANIVERLDRNDDGGLSMSDRWRPPPGGRKRVTTPIQAACAGPPGVGYCLP